MASFPLPSQIQTQYFQILQSLKPSLNVNDPNSDFVIRGNVFAGIASGLYGDQAKTDNDTFISTMSPAALTLKGADFGLPQNPATPADSEDITIPGSTNGTIITPGQLTFLYIPTNVLYTNTTGGTVAGGTITLSILAQTAGQIGNVAAPDTLQVVSPPSGIGPTANVVASIADGTDAESTDAYRARLLAREQNPPAGGNAADYYAWAFEADPSVRSAAIFRFGRGLGTVDIYITTGTTDIDTAVTQGLSIVRIPSSGLLATVQAYYDSVAPLTDCPEVFAPTELDVNVTVTVDVAAGLTLTSVPSDPVNNPLNLTVQQLIVREVGRVLYKYATGGRALPGYPGGYVVAQDIDQGLGKWLSAVVDPVTNTTIGIIPVLADWEVSPLNSPDFNLQIAANDLPAPGTITVLSGD